MRKLAHKSSVNFICAWIISDENRPPKEMRQEVYNMQDEAVDEAGS